MTIYLVDTHTVYTYQHGVDVVGINDADRIVGDADLGFLLPIFRQYPDATGVTAEPHLIIYIIVIAAFYVVGHQKRHLTVGLRLLVGGFPISQYSLSGTEQQRRMGADDIIGIVIPGYWDKGVVMKKIDTFVGSQPVAVVCLQDIIQVGEAFQQFTYIGKQTEPVKHGVVSVNTAFVVESQHLGGL